MTGPEILQEIRTLGRRLDVRGDRLHVDAPKGVLTPEHREALAAFKPELMRLLRAIAADSEASRERLERLEVSIAVWDDGSMRVTEYETDILQSQKDGGTVYTPADMFYFIQLQPNERRLFHKFKKLFGGRTEWRVKP